MDALKAYADDHGKFPRAYVQDEEGRRKHSWRVLILPYLDKDEIYNQYDFAQSWDSPHNLALAPEIAELFQCPSDPAVDLENPHTNYFAVAGPGTLWEDRVSIATLKGPLHEIIAVVEMAVTEDLEVKVFEPRDLRFDDLLSGINRRENGGPSSNHPRGAFFALSDGHVEFLNAGEASELQRRLESHQAAMPSRVDVP